MPDRPLSDELVPWFEENARDLPWRRPGFGAWGTLVSEFMLQQTQVARVIPRLDEWLTRWPTARHLADDAPAEAVRLWANLGYPRRALWLHAAAVQIRDRFDGEVPSSVDDLLSLSGIGDYTARAVASFAHGQAVPVVDTNTRRVIARAIHGKSQPADAAKRDLADMNELLPSDPQDAVIMNQAMMELGQTVCTSRGPKCGECPIRTACAWAADGYPHTGDTRKKQSKFDGSDRQARGAVLRVLREKSPASVPLDELIPTWPDTTQRDRAIVTLMRDGLLEADGDRASLPGASSLVV